jgi:hypothetical protein
MFAKTLERLSVDDRRSATSRSLESGFADRACEMADALPTNLRRRCLAGACYGNNGRVFCTAGFEFRERLYRNRLADLYASNVAG